ncbi:biotin-dependent carboxyltransferase family protein [Bacillus piscicola]|uniref:5-oxoprolinase subunit C family protein n=1 Tax=Bacillus piscicola TaxID=1632684 RepID=UPI001F092089|nr:biotin-dependent carboxyltransferase family protein [Bacillus piscicola]
MKQQELCYVRKPGLFTTIQDSGRYGFQRQGISPAGAMDPYALALANMLVGNEASSAVLEITITGPTLLFKQDTVAAVTGADVEPILNGNRIAMWKSFAIEKGDELRFKGARSGMRAYLGVQGGFAGEGRMSSHETYVRANIGGVNGRELQRGDTIFCYGGKQAAVPPGTALHEDLIPGYPNKQVLRVLAGPEEDAFTEEALTTFYQSLFTVTNEADRMGLRLKGARLAHARPADILSDAATFGTVQVAAEGQPIILMADRQTTGGYTRIANVISVDLSKAAQVRPGQQVSFRKVTLRDAHELMRKERKLMRSLATRLADQQT